MAAETTGVPQPPQSTIDRRPSSSINISFSTAHTFCAFDRRAFPARRLRKQQFFSFLFAENHFFRQPPGGSEASLWERNASRSKKCCGVPVEMDGAFQPPQSPAGPQPALLCEHFFLYGVYFSRPQQPSLSPATAPAVNMCPACSLRRTISSYGLGAEA